MGDSRDRLATTIDLRLTDIWADVFEAMPEGVDAELLGWLLRAAYGQGYTDALRETTRGQLCLDLGYAIPDTPERQQAGSPSGSARRGPVVIWRR